MRGLLGAGLLCWSSAAAADEGRPVSEPAVSGTTVPPANDSAAPAAENVYAGPKLTTDPQADHAFKLLAEGQRLLEQKAWDKARDKLLEAWKYGEFPNIAYHLAIAYEALGDQAAASEQLSKFLGMIDGGNPNYEAATTLQAKLRKAASPAESSHPAAGATNRSKAPVGPIVLAASGAAMLLAAVTTGLLANAAEGELTRNCPNGHCDPKLQEVADRGQTLKVVTNVLLVTGGVALGSGAAWWIGAACSSSSHGCSAAFTGQF